MECGNLNENGTYRSPVGGTFWEKLGSVTLLEKVYRWSWALKLQNTSGIPSAQFLLGCRSRYKLSGIPLLYHHGLSKTINKIKYFIL